PAKMEAHELRMRYRILDLSRIALQEQANQNVHPQKDVRYRFRRWDRPEQVRDGVYEAFVVNQGGRSFLTGDFPLRCLPRAPDGEFLISGIIEILRLS